MAGMVVKSPKTPASRGLQVYPSHGGVIQEQSGAQRGCHHCRDGEMTQILAETQFLSLRTSRYRKSLRQLLHTIWTFFHFALAAPGKIHSPFGLRLKGLILLPQGQLQRGHPGLLLLPSWDEQCFCGDFSSAG